MKEVKVVIKQPGRPAVISKITDDYKAIQKVVGGIFQCLPLPIDNDVQLICNDEGKLCGMESNIFLPEYEDMVVGNIIFTAYDEEGNLRDLNKEEINGVLDYCRENSAPYIAPESDEYASFMRVEVYFDSRKKDDLDMGD